MGLMDLFRSSPREAPRRASRPHSRWRWRGFNGAKDNRLVAGWSTHAESINENLYQDLPSLRARSRDLYLNNDFVRRFVSMSLVNVVGPRGVILQSRVPSAKRGDMDLDSPACDAIEAAFATWGRRQNCDLLGRLDWVALQRQAVASWMTDGEILVQLHEGSDAGPHGFQVEHLDPELLDVKHKGDVRGGNRIIMGIEYDPIGRAVAYHLRQRSDPTRSYAAIGGKRYERIEASRIIHGFNAEQVGQLRGYPPSATAMLRLKMLEGYFDAAVTAARAGAAKMGFIKQGPAGQYTGDETDDDGSAISDFEAGIIERLNDGEEFQGFDPRYPHEQFGAFVKTCLQTIAGSLGPGVSYSALSGDLEGVNYSSIRAGVLEEREAWKSIQEMFISFYVRPIFERWLANAMTNQVIMVAGLPLKQTDYARYSQASLQGRRWAWVDPRADMEASISAVNNNITTVSATIRELGQDPDSVFAERSLEKAKLKKLGLTEAETIKAVANV